MQSALLPLLLLSSAALNAAGRVEIEIANDPKNQQLEAQQWYKVFTDLKVGGLQIRTLKATDKVGVTTQGGATQPTYKVIGILSERNVLTLPGGRFTLRDQSRLADWLKSLADNGPGGAPAKDAPFGLGEAQLKQVHDALRKPVTISTKGASRRDLLTSLTPLSTMRIVTAAGLDAALNAAGPVEEEFKGLSLGTSLSAILRPAGLGLVPRRAAGGAIELSICKPAAGEQYWPVGFAATDRERELLPVLYESIEVEIDNIPLNQALDAIAPRLAVPILRDHNGMATVNVDPATVKVNLPAKKLSYSLILRKLLGQTKLVHEVRTDEAGKPFLWVTTLGSK